VEEGDTTEDEEDDADVGDWTSPSEAPYAAAASCARASLLFRSWLPMTLAADVWKLLECQARVFVKFFLRLCEFLSNAQTSLSVLNK